MREDAAGPRSRSAARDRRRRCRRSPPRSWSAACSSATGGRALGGRLPGCSASLLAVRARTIRRPSLLYVVIVGGVSPSVLIVIAPTGIGNVFDLGAEIASTRSRPSDVLRPPVDFQPGWQAIVGWLMAAVGFAAAWVAHRGPRPALGLLVPLPIVGVAAISVPELRSRSPAALVVLVLFALGLGVLSQGAEDDESGRRSATRCAGRCGRCRSSRRHRRAVLRVQVDFLFPPPVIDPTQEPQKPKTVPLSEVEDRVLFEVDAKITGPWRIGSLDVYDGKDWRLPPFADSELTEVPGERGRRRRVTGPACGPRSRSRPRRRRAARPAEHRRHRRRAVRRSPTTSATATSASPRARCQAGLPVHRRRRRCRRSTTLRRSDKPAMPDGRRASSSRSPTPPPAVQEPARTAPNKTSSGTRSTSSGTRCSRP